MQKTRRAAAQGCLLEAAQFMERAYTTNMTYALAKFPELGCIDEQADFYAFGFSGTPDADSYVVQAVPQGAQEDDTLCGTMSVDQAGVKTESGTAASAGDCW
jgi:type IV pilus assembly protein PilE